MRTLTRDYAAKARTASAVNILLGVWLIVSPWMFVYDMMGRRALVNSVLVGALIAIFAACRLAALSSSVGLSGVNFGLALWAIASPWICGYATYAAALWNNVIVGVFIAALAICSGGATMAEQKHPRGAPAQ